MRYTRIFTTLVAVTLACGSALAQGEKEAAEAAKAGLEASQAKDWNKAITEFKRAADADKKYAPNLSAALQLPHWSKAQSLPMESVVHAMLRPAP